MMGALLGVISDFHGVLRVSADPVDVRNDYLFSSRLFFKFSDVNLGSGFDPF